DIYNVTPSWVTPSILQELKLINQLSFYHLLLSPDINRLRAGPLIKDILDNIQNLISGSSSGKKAKIYSAHDMTIASVLSFFGANYVHQPPYAGALFFDVYQTDTNSYAIQIDYQDRTNSNTTYPIQIQGCPSTLCPLEVLNTIYQPRIPVDIDVECQRRSKSTPTSNRYNFPAMTDFLHSRQCPEIAFEL
ncbi:unnamed protein product, partial [Didymodactylos carnosus]